MLSSHHEKFKKEDFIQHQDDEIIHLAKDIKIIAREKNIPVLQCPTCSSEFNPIQYLERVIMHTESIFN